MGNQAFKKRSGKRIPQLVNLGIVLILIENLFRDKLPMNKNGEEGGCMYKITKEKGQKEAR